MKRLMIAIVIALLFVGCAHSPRPWTKEEKIAAGFFVLAHTADYYTTQRMLDVGNGELNPALGRHPSDSQVNMYFSLTGIGALLVGHYWPDARKSILWGYGGLNAGWACYNTHLY